MESNNNKKLVKLDDRVKQVGGTLIIKEAKVQQYYYFNIILYCVYLILIYFLG